MRYHMYKSFSTSDDARVSKLILIFMRFDVGAGPKIDFIAACMFWLVRVLYKVSSETHPYYTGIFAVVVHFLLDQ